MRRLATCAAIATLALTFAMTAQAQDSARRCGGLLCDMGLFGGATSASSALPCNDFLCRAMGGRQADASPPPPPVAAPMQAEPAPMKHQRKKRMVAKAAMKPAAAPDTVMK